MLQDVFTGPCKEISSFACILRLDGLGFIFVREGCHLPINLSSLMRPLTPEGIETPEDYDILSATSDIDGSDNEVIFRGIGPDIGEGGASFQMPHLPSLDSGIATTSLTIDPPLSSEAYARIVPALDESHIAETCLRFPAAANAVPIGPVDFELLGATQDTAQLVYSQIAAKLPLSGRLDRCRLLWEDKQFVPGSGLAAVTGTPNKRRIRLCYHGLTGINPKARGPDPIIPLAHDIVDSRSSQYRRIISSSDAPLVEILHADTMEVAAVPIPADSLSDIPLAALINVRGEPVPLRDLEVESGSEASLNFGRRSWMLLLLSFLLASCALGYRVVMHNPLQSTTTTTSVSQPLEVTGALQPTEVSPGNEIVQGLRLVGDGVIGSSTAVMLGVERGINFILERIGEAAHVSHVSVCNVISQMMACHRGPGVKQCILDHDELLVARDYMKDDCAFFEDSLSQWAYKGREQAIEAARWIRDNAAVGSDYTQKHAATWAQLAKDSLLKVRRTSLDTLNWVYHSYALNQQHAGDDASDVTWHP